MPRNLSRGTQLSVDHGIVRQERFPTFVHEPRDLDLGRNSFSAAAQGMA